MKTLGYKHTIFSCFWAYICQAIIVNFVPLFFLTFSRQYNIPIEEITVLIATNFVFQLLTDAVATKYAARIGYRRCLVAAHVLCGSGLVLMTLLPEVLPPLLGFCIAAVVYAVGGGLLEVLISPLVESCPTDNKAGVMSIMHSFYCWGVVLTVAVSAVFFAAFGTDNWKIMALIWSVLPFANSVFLCFVPMDTLSEAEESRHSPTELFRHKLFWVMLVLMLCAGAAELAVAQWASAFAESGLKVDKTTGDLIGACGFALAMALSRTLYGKFSERISLQNALLASALMCTAGYLLIGLSTLPALGLVGCIICGFSVGIFWPGTLSLASSRMPTVTTAMFAIMAIAGDMGCTLGPTLVGAVSGIAGGNLHLGILSGVIFPLIVVISIIVFRRELSDGQKKNEDVISKSKNS